MNKQILKKAINISLYPISQIKSSLFSLPENSLVVVAYHKIEAPRADSLTNYLRLSPSLFEKQIKWLNRNFRIISPSLLENCLESKQKLPPKALLVTFDDGTPDFFETALPILEKYNISPLLFLVASNICDQKMLWWEQLERIVLQTRKLRVPFQNDSLSVKSFKQKRKIFNKLVQEFYKLDSGKKIFQNLQEIERLNKIKIDPSSYLLTQEQLRYLKDTSFVTIGSHTYTHPNLVVIKEESDISYELGLSKEKLREFFKKDIKFLAYPGGKYNQQVMRAARGSAYLGAFSTDGPLNAAPLNPYAIKRVSFNQEDGWTGFINKTNNLLWQKLWQRIKNY
jgi:peptidoglycan/xylan/chitin deacetylase (PgdA/CDA1 family)